VLKCSTDQMIVKKAHVVGFFVWMAWVQVD
jgi:hypothetical protein